MTRQNQETDYFIPILTPYVQWVDAYGELIPALYEQHKTVRRTWKAFREAVPGVEQRLEFGAFEQILLFSLFLSEWSEVLVQGGTQAASRRKSEPSKDSVAPGTDEIIQELQAAYADRDKAIWNLKHLEETVGRFRGEKESLEDVVESLRADAGGLKGELATTKAHLERVIHELDVQRGESAALRVEGAALKRRRTSLEQRIQNLVKKLGQPVRPGVQTVVCTDPRLSRVTQGASQMVIQWPGQPPVYAVKQGTSRDLKSSAAKKVDKWNAQLAKDGYYRLYRKIKGKVHSIYIGKELDFQKARLRIAEKERLLLGHDHSVGP